MLFYDQDLFAAGESVTPHPVLRMLLGGRRDFCFGVYGRAERARQLLANKWAGGCQR